MGIYINKRNEEENRIPNKENRGEFENTIKQTGWSGVTHVIEQSKALLEATLRGDAEAVARGVELAHDKTVDTAIDQIKRKKYPAKLAEYTGDILLVGISYNKKEKTHECKIEQCTIK